MRALDKIAFKYIIAQSELNRQIKENKNLCDLNDALIQKIKEMRADEMKHRRSFIHHISKQ